MKKNIGIKIFNLSWVLALIAFTGYCLLDTFVIFHTYSTASAAVRSEIVFSESKGTYDSENISISVNAYRYEDTTVYVADVSVTSPEYLYTALANNSYGKNVTASTSDIAEDAGAILAINGDYYGAQESGYVIRNGSLYRDTAASDNEDLVINSDGSFEIINESETSAKSLIENNVSDVLAFGPALLIDGEIAVTKNEEVGKAMASNPRTAIGEIDNLHYLFVVSDGRTSDSEGLSLSELAYFMQEMGCKTAYNLDGGGSSTMYFNGEVINNPTSIGLGGGGKSSKKSDSGTSASSNKAGGKGIPGGGRSVSASDVPHGGRSVSGADSPHAGKPGSGEDRTDGERKSPKKSETNITKTSVTVTGESDSSDVSERKVSDIVCIGE